MDALNPIEPTPALTAQSLSLIRRYRLISAAGLLLALLAAVAVH